jgi:hypothetical protein
MHALGKTPQRQALVWEIFPDPAAPMEGAIAAFLL